jgi:hypothetical protein
MKTLTCVLVILVVAAASSTDLDAPSASELQVQLNAAILQHKNEFIVPPGHYNFSAVSATANFNISEAVSMRLVATNATFWFNCVASKTGALCPGVNISNCDGLHVSGLSIDYYRIPGQTEHSESTPPSSYSYRLKFNPGTPAITYNILNSSNVTSEDITIYKAPYFVVTAFNGGGGHVFRRFHLPGNASHFNKGRDLFHFTDLRRGVTLEDSAGGFCGDDFFNSHNTVMVVLKQESPTSLLIINPHVLDMYTKYGKNTIYGTNSVLENLHAGDELSFFAFTEKTWVVDPLGKGDSPYVVGGAPEKVTDESVIADAQVLAGFIQRNHSTVSFDASDIWRVQLTSSLPPTVAEAALVNLDSFSTPGTVIRNNTFIRSKYHLGRFKSNGGRIVNNTFLLTSSQLEMSPILEFFEGNLPVVRDVVVADNMVTNESPSITSPILCSPLTCGGKQWQDVPCVACPQDSPFSKNITVHGNNITN